MTMSGYPYCPHKQNPRACLQCFQDSQKQKAIEAARPKPPMGAGPSSATQGGPNLPQGRVVGTDPTQNPQIAMLLARKQQAMEAVASRLPGPQIAATTVNPHDHALSVPRGTLTADEGDEPADSPDGGVSDEEVSALEQVYPARPSIIDTLPRHPDEAAKQGYRPRRSRR